MANLLLKKTNFDELRDKMRSMAHLWECSLDINYWKFDVRPAPAGSPATLDHLFVGIDKKTGTEQSWLMDVTEAIDGSFEQVHQRHIYAFTQALIELKELKEQYQAACDFKKRFWLPPHEAMGLKAQSILLRGDHPQSWD